MPTDLPVDASSGGPAVVAADLSASRGGRSLWSNLTFTVERGESLAITGQSGTGKSTLLHCLSRLERPDTGSVEIDGTLLAGMSRTKVRQLRRRTVGHVFQDYALVESWSVERNLDVALIGERLPKQERIQRQTEALERLGLAGFLDRRVSTLSGGEQQRVALARLLVRRPLVVLADEPSAAVDDARVEVVLLALSDLRASGSAFIVATHDSRVVDWCGDRLHLEGA